MHFLFYAYNEGSDLTDVKVLFIFSSQKGNDSFCGGGNLGESRDTSPSKIDLS